MNKSDAIVLCILNNMRLDSKNNVIQLFHACLQYSQTITPRYLGRPDALNCTRPSNRHEIIVLLLFHLMKYLAAFFAWSCYRNRKFTKSAQIWSQNVPHVLTKKTNTHTLCF